MKKISLVIFAFVIVCAFAACSGSVGEPESDTGTTKEFKTRVDTTNRETTTTPDAAFASETAASSLAEVAWGKLALTKSSNKKIKLLANMMLKDHGNVSNELKAIAKAKAITLPTVLNAKYQAKKDSLKQLVGVTFDQAFVTSTIAGHQRILKLLQNEAEHGKDEDLKAFAAKTAITVQSRLNDINMLYQSMK